MKNVRDFKIRKKNENLKLHRLKGKCFATSCKIDFSNV